MMKIRETWRPKPGAALAALLAGIVSAGCSPGAGKVRSVEVLEARIAREHPEVPDLAKLARYYEVTGAGRQRQIVGVWIGAVSMPPGMHIVEPPDRLPSYLSHAGCEGGGFIKMLGDAYTVTCDALMPLPPQTP